MLEGSKLDLILKPTELCNFKCTFCSSSDITTTKKDKLDLTYVERFLTRFPKTRTIIVNGGDPLMMSPDYYWEILNILKRKEMEHVTLSFTSNLWDFKKRPEKWRDLFRHPQVGVGTSFHYGENRLITTSRVFTEADFLEISDLFLAEIGYRPDFISVIDASNQDRAIDNVRLAKRINVECKLNYANASGRQGKSFLIADIYEIYLEIYRQGLMQWEYNTKQLVNVLNTFHTTCPLARNCDSGIRALHPNGEYYPCGAFGDDRMFPIDFDKEMASDHVATPISNSINYAAMKPECYACEMFNICNGCRKGVRDTIESGRVELHCKGMKAISGDLLATARNHNHTVKHTPA